ncbi:MarR family EPS-associated transcriptional regulator [Kordiimonas pumila]|uniref:MarR family EPS-associated transcriptional regulator n=1 Tax=Kordiimonas pumila TaxID=2161677 RepID=A0ABV7D6I8_9PROT|nr:MarR family EPS-associated transcriptional regulator [Kordiimonas pumila]
MQEEVHFRILHLLNENPEMSQRDLADAVGVSVGGAHYVLNALVKKGFVKLGNFSSTQDKRRYSYILTPKGLAEKAAITQHFLERKLEEYHALKVEIDELRHEISQEVGYASHSNAVSKGSSHG